MGYGDDIIATGMARGAAARGKRIAFGNSRKIIWGPYSAEIFRGNPNIAAPGQEHKRDIEWIPYYKGCRIYNKPAGNRWVWNYDFKIKPGEIYLNLDEEFQTVDNLVLIEPNVAHKANAPNKQWNINKFREVVRLLQSMGLVVKQFNYGGVNSIVDGIRTINFRRAMGVLKAARLAILPEGGLHHAAAAVGCPAIVLFGGFAPPSVLGYSSHINLTGGAEACGSFTRCPHCIKAMESITPEEVVESARKYLCQ